MRRPLTALAFALAAGILLAHYTDIQTWHLCILCMGACFVSVCCQRRDRGPDLPERVKRRRLLLLCMLVLTAGSLRMEACAGRESPVLAEVEASGRQVVSFEGLVTTASFRGSRWDLTVKTGRETVLVRLDAGEEERMAVCALAGRRCRFTGPARRPDGRRNFGCFDYALYLKGRGVLCLCEVSRYRAQAGELQSLFLHGLSLAKARFLDGIAPYMDRESFSLLAGLMFGEKGYLDEDTYEAFQRNGIAHVLAVSGLHVGLVYAVMLKLLGEKRNAKTTAAASLSLLCYVCLSNFSISVLRAAFMIGLRLAAFHLRRRYDLVSAASLAALVFLLWNPYQLFDSGFQLSYMAAYSLGVALPRMQLKATELADRYKKGWIDDLGKVFLPCIAVQLGMTPLTLFHFLILSPISFLLNPFAIALAGLLLPAGLVLFFLQGPGFPLLIAAGAGPVCAFSHLLLLLNQAGTAAGGSFSMAAPPIGMLCLYYGLFFFWFSEGRAVLLRRGRQRAAALLCAGMLGVSALAPFCFGLGEILPWRRPCRDLVFADVGQGDCIHIRAGSCDVLVDGGGSAMKNVGEGTLLPYLLKNGVTGVDLAIVTHPDMDHSKGIQELSRVMEIGTIVFPKVYESLNSVTDSFSTDRILFAERGDVIRAGEAQFRVLTPFAGDPAPGEGDDRNETCITGILEYNGLTVLLAADMTDSMEGRLLAYGGADLKADILKVAHHGSAYSTSEPFLQAVSPAIAVISCGRNNSYGHPAGRVTDLLEEKGVRIFRTDIMGAVGVTRERGGSLRIENAEGSIREYIPAKAWQHE